MCSSPFGATAPCDEGIFGWRGRQTMEGERCGAVGNRSADFMWRSILRSDWSLSVSDCDLIYSGLALLTIKYFILLGHRVLSSYSGPLPAQAHYRTVPAPQRLFTFREISGRGDETD